MAEEEPQFELPPALLNWRSPQKVLKMAGIALAISWLPFEVLSVVHPRGRVPFLLGLIGMVIGVALFATPRGALVTLAGLLAGLQVLMGFFGIISPGFLSKLVAVHFVAISGFVLYCLFGPKQKDEHLLLMVLIGLALVDIVLTVIIAI